MGFTLKFYRFIFFQKWRRMIHFRGGEVLYLLAFHKNKTKQTKTNKQKNPHQLCKLLQVTSSISKAFTNSRDSQMRFVALKQVCCFGRHLGE